MKIKRIIGILILLAIVLSFSSCKKKPYESSAPAQNGAANSDNVEVNTIEDAYTEISAVGTASEKKSDLSYPFADIFSEDIGEVTLGHHQDRVASKTYTDDEALTKIVEYLEKAPMVTKVDQDDERKYSVSYFLEIKDKNGDLKYKIYFSSPVIEENIFCELYSVKNVNTDGTTDGESQFFCLDGEYLSEFLEDVETIDGREPCWLYADMFEEKFKSYDDPVYAVIKCGETVKEYTYDENSKDLGVEDLGVRLRYLPVRLAGDSDKEWQESLGNVTVSFYDSDKKLICKCVLNGYVEDNNREQIMFYDGADSEGVLYLIKKVPHLEKTNFDYFMEDYLS